jgi:hypothetical protein
MRLVVLTFALYLCGCGYMGEPLPPALNRPETVQDIAAVERGSNIVVQFTIPKITTEGIPLKREQIDIQLRVATAGPGGFNMEAWRRTADLIPVSAEYKPGTLARVEVPAAKYNGKTVNIAVEVLGPSGHTAGLSRFANVEVIPELPTPQALEAADLPDAVQLEWHAGAPEFRIFRKLVSDVAWTQIGDTTKPSYADDMIEYDKTYQYMVQSIQKTQEGTAESELSDVKTFKPVDKFPPAIPVGVTAVPGTRTIELVWTRNTEKDFAGYRVYRDGRKVTEGLTAPAFTDRDVQPKIAYHYEVSAVDTAGNESARSTTAEAVIP